MLSAAHAVSTAVRRPAGTLPAGWHDVRILAPQVVSTGGSLGYPVDDGVPRRDSVRAYGRLHVEARTRVGANTRSHFGVLNAEVLGARGGWCQVDAKANERADRRAGACTRG